MTSISDRYRGCLLGLACGDALGGPVEFDSRAKVAEMYPDGLRDFVGGGWLHLEPGEITDDTQTTIALARSLVEHPELDMKDVAARFVAWADTDPKDIGNTTRAAINSLRSGVPWHEAGEGIAEGGRAAGNASVMRCAPVAMRFRHDPERLCRASIDTARITHADERCADGAVAVNAAIAILLDGASKEAAWQAAIASTSNAEMRRAVERAPTAHRDEIKSGGYVVDTVGAAFWAFLQHDSLEDVIVAAVMLGADTDTTGAVAGALAGAHYGATNVPDRWLTLLQPRDELEQLSDRLLEISES